MTGSVYHLKTLTVHDKTEAYDSFFSLVKAFQNWHGLCFVTLKIKKADIKVGQRALAQENVASQVVQLQTALAEHNSLLQCCDLSET